MNRPQAKPDLQKLLEKKMLFEQKPMIKEYHTWLELPEADRVKAYQKWEQYYKEVKETPIAHLFQEQRIAGRKGDWARVKDLAEQAREMKKNGDVSIIEKPKYPEPEVYYHDQLVLDYRSLLEDIKRVKNEVPFNDF